MKTELVATLVAVLACSPVSAQWSVEAAAGGTDHAQVAASGSLNAIVGLQYQGRQWGYLTGGAPLDSASLPWLVGGVGQRVARYVGAFDLGADLAGHGHAYRTRESDTGSGFVAELLPFIGTDFGRTHVELASGLRYYSNTFAGVSESRAVSDTNIRGTATPSAGVFLGAQGRYIRSEDGGFPFAGASVDVAAGNAVLSAHAGRWMGDLLDEPEWGASATVAVGRNTSVTASFDQEAPDPLFWNPARKSWGFGVRYGFGRRPRYQDAAPVQPRGPVQFTVPAAETAGPVSIAGDFSDWEAVPMELVGDDWIFTIPLEPGVYHYGFKREDGSWFLPSTVSSRVDDGFGGESAVLIVGGGTDE